MTMTMHTLSSLITSLVLSFIFLFSSLMEMGVAMGMERPSKKHAFHQGTSDSTLQEVLPSINKRRGDTGSPEVSLRDCQGVLKKLFSHDQRDLQIPELSLIFNIAKVFEKNTKTEEKAKSIFKVLVQIPNLPFDDKMICYRSLAKIYALQNNLREAERYIQRACKLDPKNLLNRVFFGTLSCVPGTVAEKYLLEVIEYWESKTRIEDLNDKEILLIAQAQIALGNLKYTKTHYKDYRYWFLAALDLLEKLPSESPETPYAFRNKAKAMIALGKGHFKGKYNESWNWLLEAKNLLDPLPLEISIELLAESYICLGNFSYHDNQFPDTASLFLKALDLLEKTNNYHLKVQALIGLGNEGYSGRGKASPDWFLEALQILEKNDNRFLRVRVLIGLGNSRYVDTDKHKKQSDWYLEALRVLGNCSDYPYLKAKIFLGLGNYFLFGNNNVSTALAYYKKALEIEPWNQKARQGIEKCESRK